MIFFYEELPISLDRLKIQSKIGFQGFRDVRQIKALFLQSEIKTKSLGLGYTLIKNIHTFLNI